MLVTNSEAQARNLINPISNFLEQELALKLHPKKIILRKTNQGIDFLGYILLPHHRVLRAKTRARTARKLHQRTDEYRHGMASRQTVEQALQSYLGVFSHADAYALTLELKNQYWFWLNE
ncbi:MAG: hypothetical protein A2588_00335 [Candidatus Veblenbacteria bacterium RIFOXYD1_FULL_43_11]|uniref:Reverse transcriptase domain-containing protein n=1 Tax=Candidatus Veblenbacteria bacterium RIFOXYD1_FULL_43_11 TaxID=1802429 RepID=A0A1G2Q724_9BACT|nr:MAG: hypothetical protein A2588_00335 [Candidatus Veblenbacteria bacterium RIFOXYD1_FULL_43_11]